MPDRTSATAAAAVLSTPAGDVELKIPKVRAGSFFPSLLEPRRRVDKALWGVIMTAYITGTSTRKVDDLVRAGGFDRRTLVVVTTTGSGWVDPGAVDSVEYITGGDTATVSIQYS